MCNLRVPSKYSLIACSASSHCFLRAVANKLGGQLAGEVLLNKMKTISEEKQSFARNCL